MCPGFPGVGLLDCGLMLRVRSCCGAVRIRSGVSMPSAEWRLAVVEDLAVFEDRVGQFELLLARGDEDRPHAAGRGRPHPGPAGRQGGACRRASRCCGVSLVLDVPAELTARVDSGRIRQAVDNLLDNALRFAPAGAAIGIAGRPADDDLVIEVTDTGPGLPVGYLAHAFDRFARDAG
jgi:signal transduction histidine kinase